MELIIFALFFLLLGLVASLWGVDSRDGFDWKPSHPFPPR